MEQANTLIVKAMERYEKRMMVPNIIARYEQQIERLAIGVQIQSPNVTIVNNFFIGALNYITAAIQNVAETMASVDDNSNVAEDPELVSYGQLASEIGDYTLDVTKRAIHSVIKSKLVMKSLEFIKKRITGAVKFIGSLTQSFNNLSVVIKLKETIVGFVGSIAKGIRVAGDAITNGMNKVKTHIQGIVNKAVEPIKKKVNDIKITFTDKLERFKNIPIVVKVKEKIDKSLNKVRALPSKVRDKYDRTKERIKNSKALVLAGKVRTRVGKSFTNAKTKMGDYRNNLKEKYGKPQEGKATRKIMISSIGLFKKIWKSSIGKGLMLGIGKNKEVSKMMTDIKGKWENTWINMGQKIAPLLKPALNKVMELMDSSAIKNIIKLVTTVIGTLVNVIVNGVTILLNYLSPVIDIIGGIFGVLIDNAEIVLVVLGAVASAILAMAAVTAAMTLKTVAYNAISKIRIILEKGLNAVLNVNPTMLIIRAIILLIIILIALIATIEPVRKAVADLTRGFFDFIEWGINGLIEGLASAAEGILRFAGDGINAFLNVFVNPFIDGINLIIDGLNLLGANINNLDHLQVDFSIAAEATGEFIRKGKVDLSGAKEAVAGAIENFSAEALKEKLGIGALEDQANDKDVGVQINKINDDVNIADEDIKLMRDVAEREMIQNFVTLTPTVSMGDMTVNENADADRLLGKITEALVTEVTNSAQGVYA